MTLIFAVRDGHCAVLGCDSLYCIDDAARNPKKCFKAWEVSIPRHRPLSCTETTEESDEANEESNPPDKLLFGCAGDVHDMSLLQHSFRWPERAEHEDVHAWLIQVVAKMHRFLSAQPGAKPAFEIEMVDAVVCTKAHKERVRLFEIAPDQTVTEHDAYVSAGSASNAANAAYEALLLHDSMHDKQTSSWDAIETVMKAVESVRTDVRRPVLMFALV